MKKIFKNYKSLALFLISSIFILLSPIQKEYLKLIFVLILHELGHIFFLSLFNVKINNFKISIFGGFIDSKIDLSLYQELLIYSGGIIFNIIILLIPKLYNYSLLLIIFNILPIYPLDGYNIFKSIISDFLDYHKTLYLSYIISIITSLILILLSIIYLNALILINLIYCLIFSIINYKAISFEYNKFLFNKYKYYKKRKYKYLYKLKKYPFFKYHNTIIWNNDIIITDYDLLKKRFNSSGGLN